MRSISLIALVLMVTILLSSCARKMHFANSPIVPAATGYAQVKKDKNGNYIISVSVRNLAEAKRLTPPKNVYVVWMESAGNSSKNLGQMKSSSGILSSKLKGSMQGTATSKPTAIFITAEDDGDVQYPSMQVVLRTQ